MNCPLCSASKQKFRLVKSNETAFSVICKFPLKEGHVIVLPKRHVISLSDLTEKESNDLLVLIDEILSLIKSKYSESPGIHLNTGVHGTQKHIHFHVLPSKGGLRDLISKYEGVHERKDVSDGVLERYKNILLE